MPKNKIIWNVDKTQARNQDIAFVLIGTLILLAIFYLLFGASDPRLRNNNHEAICGKSSEVEDSIPKSSP